MPKTPGSSVPWGAEHDTATYRALVRAVLAARPQIYATPELSEVANNGGDRINKKLQQVLRKLGSDIPDGASILQEEVASGSNRGKGAGGARSEKDTPTKSKKRKVAKEEVKEEMESDGAEE